MAVYLGKQNPFPHRHNMDGSYDSICIRCFATLGNCETEAELVELEKLHVCDEEKLYRYKGLAHLKDPRKTR